MTPTPSAAHPRLRTIEPRQAAVQTALIAALNHREVEDLRTSARIASTRDRRAAAAWIKFDTIRGPILIAPLLVENQLARLTSGPGQPDAAAAAATLGRIEPLVAALETTLSIELHPAGLIPALADEPPLIRLDANDRGGALRHRLLVAAPQDIDIAPLPLPVALPARVATLALRWTGSIDLPPIRAARLGGLGRGDCILLGLGGLAARLSIPGRTDRITATIDVKKGTAILDREPQEGDSTVSDRTSRIDDPVPDHPAERPGWGDLQIAATIEFDGGKLTAADLATLGKGSVLSLPGLGGTLAVRVVAGGATIADGELVAVGDGFGVLVTAVHPVDAA